MCKRLDIFIPSSMQPPSHIYILTAIDKISHIDKVGKPFSGGTTVPSNIPSMYPAQSSLDIKESMYPDEADDFLVNSSDLSELLRCICISLLCVQQHPEERPSMPSPKRPSFLFYRKPFEPDSSPDIDGSSSGNETVVWVANRISPINDSSGVLRIESSGRVVLQAQNTTAVWSANTTASAQNPVLQLLDSGNLVVRDVTDTNPENYLWQSFDYLQVILLMV
ncbi:hypothetical protein V6N13_129264 [Hibiscus sabdariffa]|uniref:Bulb-type lectin domain-containing protein n=1 Tax=Hibiscus sabdariffa TaxID=183260 RepID=A0ABR2SLB6_9ROSI